MRGTITTSTTGGHVELTVRAIPLPEQVSTFLVANARTIKRLLQRDRMHVNQNAEADEDAEGGEALQQSAGEVKVDFFWTKLEEILEHCGPQWRDIVNKIWSLGPRKVGPNFLIDARPSSEVKYSLKLRYEGKAHAEISDTGAVTSSGNVQSLTAQVDDTLHIGDEPKEVMNWDMTDVEDAINTGFQLATLQGPMCAEPMQGMAFFVEKASLVPNTESRINHSQLTSATIASVREACRNGLLDWSPRLMLAMYSCDIQASTEVLGKVHGVLSRRRGRITSEEIKEGTSFFTVGSLLPVVESFGFADEIRKRTSGAASPQLVFKGYVQLFVFEKHLLIRYSFEIFDIDPYWVPRTEEELEDLGEHGERENVAKRYMDRVRKRKVCRIAMPIWITDNFFQGVVRLEEDRRRRETTNTEIELRPSKTRDLFNNLLIEYVLVQNQLPQNQFSISIV